MSTLRLFSAIFAVVSFVFIGSVSAYAQGGGEHMSSCDQLFSEYAGQKGYMDQTDFKQYWHDSGHSDSDVETMGHGVSGASGVFTGANTSNSGKLSKSEFCAWVNRK